MISIFNKGEEEVGGGGFRVGPILFLSSPKTSHFLSVCPCPCFKNSCRVQFVLLPSPDHWRGRRPTSPFSIPSPFSPRSLKLSATSTFFSSPPPKTAAAAAVFGLCSRLVFRIPFRVVGKRLRAVWWVVRWLLGFMRLFVGRLVGMFDPLTDDSLVSSFLWLFRRSE